MKEKVKYHEIFKAIEKAVGMNAQMLFCSECHKGFYKVNIVDESEPDYITESGVKYFCKDHLLYDLLVNPEITEEFLISAHKRIKKNKVQVQFRKVDAQIFIPHRLN